MCLGKAGRKGGCSFAGSPALRQSWSQAGHLVREAVESLCLEHHSRRGEKEEHKKNLLVFKVRSVFYYFISLLSHLLLFSSFPKHEELGKTNGLWCVYSHVSQGWKSDPTACCWESSLSNVFMPQDVLTWSPSCMNKMFFLYFSPSYLLSASFSDKSNISKIDTLFRLCYRCFILYSYLWVMTKK